MFRLNVLTISHLCRLASFPLIVPSISVKLQATKLMLVSSAYIRGMTVDYRQLGKSLIYISELPLQVTDQNYLEPTELNCVYGLLIQVTSLYYLPLRLIAMLNYLSCQRGNYVRSLNTFEKFQSCRSHFYFALRTRY